MEAAGTAVGISSLGIQVCQGLLSYYEAWKGYDSDISSTYNAITDLSKTLTLLKATLEQNVSDERAGRISTCVRDCQDALLELEKKRASLQKYARPEGLRQKMRSGVQRSWYPFRKGTLETLKVSVTEVQGRLMLALQVLQLDIGTEWQILVDRILSQTATQSDSIAHIAAQNQRLLDAQRSDEFKKIVAWLAPPDPGTNHATVRQHHQSKTGDWLLKSSHTEVMQLLIDKGAVVNAQGGRRYNNALQAASAGGKTEVAQLLIDNGANVNAQGGYYGNALQAALAKGYTGIVQLLIDKGANVNAQGGNYGTALQAALTRSQTEVAQLLRSFGALELSTAVESETGKATGAM